MQIDNKALIGEDPHWAGQGREVAGLFNELTQPGQGGQTVRAINLGSGPDKLIVVRTWGQRGTPVAIQN